MNLKVSLHPSHQFFAYCLLLLLASLASSCRVMATENSFEIGGYYGSTRYIPAEIVGASPSNCASVYVRVYKDGYNGSEIDVSQGYASISFSTGTGHWSYDPSTIPNGTYNVAAQADCTDGTQHITKEDSAHFVPNGCQNGPWCIAIHRFYNQSNGSHFYTADENEKRQVLKYPAFRYEGVSSFAEKTDRGYGTSAVAVHRFYNKTLGTHFYTANQSEATYVNDNLFALYRYEGVAYYAYSNYYTPLQEYIAPTDFSAPAHRFFHKGLGSHFYTTNQPEATYVNNWATSSYRYEGISYYLVRNY